MNGAAENLVKCSTAKRSRHFGRATALPRPESCSRHAPRDEPWANHAERDCYDPIGQARWGRGCDAVGVDRTARRRKTLPRRSQRAGHTLVFVAMLLFGLLGLAALVIDLGFARLAQRQMQTATDTAAVEAMRFRDEYPPLQVLVQLLDNPSACPDLSDPNAVLDCHAAESGLERETPPFHDYLRRKAGSRLVDVTFDDDLDLAADARSFGAGPAITFQDGIQLDGTDFRASETIAPLDDPLDPPVYKPRLRLNLSNAGDGDTSDDDMVPGEFRENRQFYEYVDQSIIRDEIHRNGEIPHYLRRDFIPELEHADAPSAPAMLVRLRRTGELFDPDSAASSSGPRLPFLFGRGSLLGFGRKNPTDVELRSAGIAVRATSISEAKPAMTVGAASPVNNLSGSLPFVLARSEWQDMGDDSVLQFQPDGTVWVGGNLAGRATKVDSTSDADGGSTVRTVGELPVYAFTSDGLVPSSFRTAVLSSAGLNSAKKRYGYVPIVLDIPQPSVPQEEANRIIGFGWLEFVEGLNLDELLATPQSGRTAPENASASPVNIRERDVEITRTVFDAHFTLARPLLAPALVK